MKKYLEFVAVSVFLFSCADTERDNQYDERADNYIGNICSDFVGGTEREHYGKMKKQFCDERDGKKYVYTTIGTQIWMAENLNYNVASSKCYGNKDENCVTYGRLYNWDTAKKVCPTGWHLPSKDEWKAMTAYIGGADTEGKKLKAKSGWNNNGNGTDDYGFSALPSGGGYSGGYSYVGEHSDWWSASENEDYSLAYSRYIYYDQDYAGWWENDKSSLFPIRCVKD